MKQGLMLLWFVVLGILFGGYYFFAILAGAILFGCVYILLKEEYERRREAKRTPAQRAERRRKRQRKAQEMWDFDARLHGYKDSDDLLSHGSHDEQRKHILRCARRYGYGY